LNILAVPFGSEIIQIEIQKWILKISFIKNDKKIYKFKFKENPINAAK